MIPITEATSEIKIFWLAVAKNKGWFHGWKNILANMTTKTLAEVSRKAGKFKFLSDN